ncbi:hypothetical protein LWM68_20265 [Niabella sp. W65]|nr:hypothetical protein [Niabella sp. W65]MCH7364891.1 hypothetical protein [Niabella sp. W65]ULT40725.1 hypothetical protein KRR40_39190 [Niabella sp. I65]
MLPGAPVSRYDLKGNRMKTYYNITQAAEELGITRERVRDAVHGRLLVLVDSVWRKGRLIISM